MENPQAPKRRTKHAHECCSECGHIPDIPDIPDKKPKRERKPHPLKGTDEMKQKMAALRALRKKSLTAADIEDIVVEDVLRFTS